MTTLKEAAMNYEGSETKNVADLPFFTTDVEIKKSTAKDKDGNDFAYNYIEVNGEQYRVPKSVLKGIQTILESSPNLTSFKVIKKGTGMGTEYTVIPHQGAAQQ